MNSTLTSSTRFLMVRIVSAGSVPVWWNSAGMLDEAMQLGEGAATNGVCARAGRSGRRHDNRDKRRNHFV